MGKNILNKKIGKRLRDYRESLGITQEQVAEILGKGRDAVAKIENGSISLTFTNASRLAEHFNFSLDWLLFGLGTRERFEKEIPAPVTAMINHILTDELLYHRVMGMYYEQSEKRNAELRSQAGPTAQTMC